AVEDVESDQPHLAAALELELLLGDPAVDLCSDVERVVRVVRVARETDPDVEAESDPTVGVDLQVDTADRQPENLHATVEQEVEILALLADLQGGADLQRHDLAPGSRNFGAELRGRTRVQVQHEVVVDRLEAETTVQGCNESGR